MLLPYFDVSQLEAGVDEAGRGCYAGPVVAAAVILPQHFYHPLLNDSKKLTEKQREYLKPIIQKQCVAYAIGIVSNRVIDKINILHATYKAMHKAIDLLRPIPSHLLIDGNQFLPYPYIAHTCIIKGDGKYAAIAAASILAKTCRDELMQKAHKKHPQYQWHQNKGYGTLLHRQAISTHGLSNLHRKSFKIL